MNALVSVSVLVAVLAAVAVPEVRGDCWDTGCQPNTWKVVGCAQYGRVEKGKRSCPGGYIYTCCTSVSRVVPTHPECEGQTRCLHKSMLDEVPECEKMDKKLVKKMDSRPCQKGDVYTCCDAAEHHFTSTEVPQTEMPPPPPAHPECVGETRCLLKSLAAEEHDCEKMDKKLVKKMANKPCPKGYVYSCCAHSVEHHSTDDQHNVEHHSTAEARDVNEQHARVEHHPTIDQHNVEHHSTAEARDVNEQQVDIRGDLHRQTE